jgi:integrase
LQTPIKLLNEGEQKPVPKAVTMGAVIKKYEEDYLPGLAKSTRNTDGSLLKGRSGGETLIAEIYGMEVQDWVKDLKLSPSSKGRARRMMKQLFDKAMLWRLIPLGVNPMTLVKVKGASKREKKVVLLTVKQVNALVAALPQPYSLMVLVAASLGLRAEEVVAIQWQDLDFRKRSVTIRRAFTHSELKEVKTDASAAELPVTSDLIRALKEYRTGASEWVFPSPVTGGPYSSDTILAKKIRPAAMALKLPKIGWHTFRHSFKSWLGNGKATLSQLKDAIRHADIATTANVYGGTPVEKMRPFVTAVASQLKPKRHSKATR